MNGPLLTYGELKRRLRLNKRQAGAGGMSIVNPTLTKEQALNILAKAIDGHQDDDPVTAHDHLIARHINRECGYGV